MAAKSKKIVSAESLLREIDRIFEEAEFYQSRESGKRFFKPGKFHGMLSQYIVRSGSNLRDNATKFGMSVGTLESILGGGRLSDNMLGRIRSSLSRENTAAKKKFVFPGDWHDTSPPEIANAISTVSEKLVFLKKIIASSNFLNSEESPIDKIQVLQLIALLTATLEALRAPFIDKKQTGGFFRWLRKLAKTTGQKGVEKLVVDAMEEAAKAGYHLVDHLSDGAGVPDLGNLV